MEFDTQFRVLVYFVRDSKGSNLSFGSDHEVVWRHALFRNNTKPSVVSDNISLGLIKNNFVLTCVRKIMNHKRMSAGFLVIRFLYHVLNSKTTRIIAMELVLENTVKIAQEIQADVKRTLMLWISNRNPIISQNAIATRFKKLFWRIF